jgi:DNA-binding transcriptional regulator GbsR (MarR family)
VKNLTQSRSEFAELLGRTAQAFGLTPSVGQIYGLLYLSAEPLSLDEIAESLDLSKASASIGTRQLESLHAVQLSSKNDDRRDYWETRLEPQQLLQKILSSVLAPRLAKAPDRLEDLLELMEAEKNSGELSSAEFTVCQQRIQGLITKTNQFKTWLPLIERFVK